MPSNRLRELLAANTPTVGTHLHSTWPTMVEVIGHTGMFDYVEFVAEYAPFDLFDLDNLCRAAELHGLSSMIKIDQAAQEFFAQRAVGAGFQSVLFVDTRSVEDARACIRTVRPDLPGDGGSYGATERRNWYGTRSQEEYIQAIRDVVVVLMIEKKAAVDQLEQILELDGIDMIQWGGTDYSQSIGAPDAARSAEVKEVERRVIKTCVEMGVPPRAEISSPDQAAYYMDLGVRHFSLGTELFVIREWMTTNCEQLRKRMQEYS